MFDPVTSGMTKMALMQEMIGIARSANGWNSVSERKRCWVWRFHNRKTGNRFELKIEAYFPIKECKRGQIRQAPET